MDLLLRVIKDKPISIVIATHDTAILGSLSHMKSNICFLPSPKQKNTEVTFRSKDKIIEDILPIFGAHPLTSVFNRKPPLLVEGEDDERIWQAVVRSSNGKINIWPCVAGTINHLNKYEETANEIMGAIYENPCAYSLRDRDNSPYEIDDKNFVIRFRLNCYSSENLILSNEVLEKLGTTWEQMQERINQWLTNENYTSHPRYKEMKDFSINFDRQNENLKEIRHMFLYLCDSNKPWEVLVGQAIAKLNSTSHRGEGSLVEYLGPKLIQVLNLCND